MTKLIIGKSESEVKKEQKEQMKKNETASVDELLTKTKGFNPTHNSYSLLLQDKKWVIVKVQVDLSSLQSKAEVIDYKYDNEYSALAAMNKMFSDQSQKMRKELSNV